MAVKKLEGVPGFSVLDTVGKGRIDFGLKPRNGGRPGSLSKAIENYITNKEALVISGNSGCAEVVGTYEDDVTGPRDTTTLI